MGAGRKRRRLRTMLRLEGFRRSRDQGACWSRRRSRGPRLELLEVGWEQD